MTVQSKQTVGNWCNTARASLSFPSISVQIVHSSQTRGGKLVCFPFPHSLSPPFPFLNREYTQGEVAAYRRSHLSLSAILFLFSSLLFLLMSFNVPSVFYFFSRPSLLFLPFIFSLVFSSKPTLSIFLAVQNSSIGDLVCPLLACLVWHH